jgi:hypothetical protein
MIPDALSDVLARWHRDSAGWRPVPAYPLRSKAFAFDQGTDAAGEEHEYMSRVGEVIATLPEEQRRALAHLARGLSHGVADPEGKGLPRDAAQRHALMEIACHELGVRLQRAGLI